jgi:ketohexokinase
LGQFAGVDALLVAPLAGNDEGVMLKRDLERANVNTRFCKVWEGANVPSAWVLESGEYLSTVSVAIHDKSKT